MTTMAGVLADASRRDPGRPLLTWYGERTGERVELSVTTYANWVAKVGSLLVDEHDLSRGDVLMLDLPAHWLGPVFLGAAWTAGIVIVFPGGEVTPAAVVCGPDGLDRWAPMAAQLPVLACALLPMGVRFAEALPPDVHDVGLEVWAQPDSWVPWDPPGPDDAALLTPDGPVTQRVLWATAAAGPSGTDGGRALTEANPASPPGAASFAEPLVRGGSLVLVTGASPQRRDAIAVAERVSHHLPR